MRPIEWSRSSRAECVVAALLIAAAAWFSVPWLARYVRDAARLASMPYDARRDRVSGGFTASLRKIDRELPVGEPVALVLSGARDIDLMVFANYYLYPRPAHEFFGAGHWRVTPNAPKHILLIDSARTHEVRLAKDFYEARFELARGRWITSERALSPPMQDFIVPLAATLEGSVSYATEAVLSGDATVTFEPSGVTKDVHGAFESTDTIYELFRTTGAGWLHITAPSTVRAGFWLTNRANEKSAPLPLLATLPPLPQRVSGGDSLWLLNAGDGEAHVIVDGTARTIAPHALDRIAATGAHEISGTGRVLAFTSSKDAQGQTHFGWPEGVR
ncbi:MAG TPA: hypothetical protein VFN10_08620 [Thermoanaerobaculia bacterium]|nr:hypothetical protein [Thermoanaerobaculia bacterium]